LIKQNLYHLRPSTTTCIRLWRSEDFNWPDLSKVKIRHLHLQAVSIPNFFLWNCRTNIIQIHLWYGIRIFLDKIEAHVDVIHEQTTSNYVPHFEKQVSWLSWHNNETTILDFNLQKTKRLSHSLNNFIIGLTLQWHRHKTRSVIIVLCILKIIENCITRTSIKIPITVTQFEISQLNCL